MLAYLTPITALLASTALLLLGNGLLSSLLNLRGGLEGYSDSLLGLLGSAYFLGFFIGTQAVPRMIRRMAHVRASNFFCAAIASCVLLHLLLVNIWAWMVLRVITGIALVGYYTVIESWLNSQTPATQRGQVFAVYMMVNLAAYALAQHFLTLAPVGSFELFVLAAMLVMLSVMPMAWTRLAQPTVVAAPGLTLRRVWRTAPAAFVGAIASGLVMGSFWTVSTLYAIRLGLGEGGIAMLLTVVIAGGALLQWPLGRLSDRLDRRLVLGIVALGGSLAAAAMALADTPHTLLLTAFAYGGMAFAVYPIVVAHLIDRLPQDDILAGNASVLLLYGIGAVIGPLVSGSAMSHFGAAAMPAFFAVTLAVLAVLILVTAHPRHAPVVEDPGVFMPMIRTTEAALDMAAKVAELQAAELNAANIRAAEEEAADSANDAERLRA